MVDHRLVEAALARWDLPPSTTHDVLPSTATHLVAALRAGGEEPFAVLRGRDGGGRAARRCRPSAVPAARPLRPTAARRPAPPDDHHVGHDPERRLRARADAAWATVQGDVGFVHGDLILGNHVLRRRADGWAVGLLDVAECTIGPRGHELAVLLDNLLDGRRGEDLVRAFRAGYEHHRPWPLPADRQHLDVLRAVRHLTVARWARRRAIEVTPEQAERLRTAADHREGAARALLALHP